MDAVMTMEMEENLEKFFDYVADIKDIAHRQGITLLQDMIIIKELKLEEEFEKRRSELIKEMAKLDEDE